MPKQVLVDSGPLVAICRRTDSSHEICVEKLKSLTPPLLTCWPVITEAAYLLRSKENEVQQLLDNCRQGLLGILPLTASGLLGIQAIRLRFGDQHFDFADTCLMHLSERENMKTVFTLDRRDFSVFRTTAGEALRIIP